jgi:hypothetical protein
MRSPNLIQRSQKSLLEQHNITCLCLTMTTISRISGWVGGGGGGGCLVLVVMLTTNNVDLHPGTH